MAERTRLICFSLLALNGVGAHGFAETVGITRISGHVSWYEMELWESATLCYSGSRFSASDPSGYCSSFFLSTFSTRRCLAPAAAGVTLRV